MCALQCNFVRLMLNVDASVPNVDPSSFGSQNSPEPRNMNSEDKQKRTQSTKKKHYFSIIIIICCVSEC